MSAPRKEATTQPAFASASSARVTLRRWVVMACLCLSGASIYLLPYSTEVYYKPLQTALGVDNQAIGFLMSTLGFVNFLGYVPGGWLADRFSPRTLLAFSLCATGVIGLYFATFPPYWACILVYAGWSVTSILTFWSALIKATRDWGGEREQGRAFGILEGGRGVIRFALSSLGVALLGAMAGEKAGFQTVVVFYASLNIVLGVLVWLVLKPTGAEARRPIERSPSMLELARQGGMATVLAVLRRPATWLIALVILSAYTMYLGSFYFTPFATDAFGLGVVMAGYLGAGKMILRPVSAAGAGFLGDAMSASRIISLAFVIALVSFSLFALVPSRSALLTLDAVEQPATLVDRLRAPRNDAQRRLAEALGGDVPAAAAARNGEAQGTRGPGEVAGAPDGDRPAASAARNGEAQGTSGPGEARLAHLLGALNRTLTGGAFPVGLDSDVDARPLTRELFAAAESAEEKMRARRLLLEDTLPGVFAAFSEARARSGLPRVMLVFLVVNVAFATLSLYALRGLYYALLQEAAISPALTGVAVGFVSIIGFTPDIFIPPLVGYLLDRFPGGVGYTYVFGLNGAFCVVGLVAVVLFRRHVAGQRAAAHALR
jgi:MFS family permease